MILALTIPYTGNLREKEVSARMYIDLQVGQRQVYDAIKAAGPCEGSVERSGPVGGCHDDDA